MNGPVSLRPRLLSAVAIKLTYCLSISQPYNLSVTASQFYAVATCAAGVILLLGWLYATAGNSGSTRLLYKSIFLFILPTVGLVALPRHLFQLPMSLWVVALIEEALKASAAASEPNRFDRFFLVSLFGIWELTWARPLWGLNHSQFLEGWNSLELLGLTGAGIVTVIMHGVTAEIYAFRFKRRMPLALAVCWTVHVAFNESIDLLGVSLAASLIQFLALLLLFAAFWPKELRKVSIGASAQEDRL